MTRRKRIDWYPEFHVTFVKDKKIAEVTTVSLADLGFMNDVEYPNQKMEEVPNDIAIAIVEEFMFLIEELLPRNIQDLFYKIGLDPRPAYWKFFEKAGNNLGLEKYTSRSDNKFNQFVSHTQEGIVELFDLGWKLSEIYENTCVTKTLVIDVAYSAKKPEGSTQRWWKKIDIEVALFKQNLQYERDVIVNISDNLDYTFDFMVYRDGQPVLAIQMDDYIDFFVTIDLELRKEHEECYKLLLIREQYCEEQNITLLRLNEEEYFWNDISWNKLVYKAITDVSFSKKHDEEVRCMLREIEELDDGWFSLP